jgi:hypothetical protein
MTYRRYLLGAFAAFFFIGICGHAGNAADIKAQAGQPFCQLVDDLHDYLVARVTRNLDAMHALDCGELPQGARLTILEESPSASDIGRVARVRAFILGGGGSVTGYTLIAKQQTWKGRPRAALGFEGLHI